MQRGSDCTCHHGVALRDAGGQVRAGAGGEARLHVFQASVQGRERVLIGLQTKHTTTCQGRGNACGDALFVGKSDFLQTSHSTRLFHDLFDINHARPPWVLDSQQIFSETICEICLKETPGGSVCDPLSVFPSEYFL